MSKLRFVAFFIGLFVVALAAGRIWKLKPETAEKHPVRRGEVAILTASGLSEVWLCSKKEDTYRFQTAMIRKEDYFLQEEEEANRAFSVATGTRVKVVEQSGGHWRVEVAEGPQSGQTGWLEVEFLRPLKRGES
jgi:hypothetical protein